MKYKLKSSNSNIVKIQNLKIKNKTRGEQPHSYRHSMENLTTEVGKIREQIRTMKSPTVRSSIGGPRQSQEELSRTQVAAGPANEKFQKLMSNYESQVNKQRIQLSQLNSKVDRVNRGTTVTYPGEKPRRKDAVKKHVSFFIDED